MTRMSAMDAAWFQMEAAKSPADIVAFLQVEGELDAALVRTLIETRVLTRPPFRQRVVAVPLGLGRPEWRDDPEFSLDRHFTIRRVAAPGGQAELEAVMNLLVNEALDFDHSPWRACLIEGLAQGSVFFARLHHCMGDGFALVDVMLSLADERNVATPSSAATADLRARVASMLENVRRLAPRAPRALADLAYLLRLSFDPANDLRGKLGGVRRVAWSSAIDLTTVKAIAHAHRATINDVVMAAIGGAVRRYLKEQGPVPPRLRAMVPVNMRPSSQPLDLAHGNWFGLVLVDLPIAEPDPEARIARMKHTIDSIKASEQPGVSLGVLTLVGLVPKPLERLIEYIFVHKASLVVSNVPGPRDPFHLAGRLVRDVVFWVPHAAGLACGISILSYAGRLRIGVRSDAAVVTDPARIVQYIERELA